MKSNESDGILTPTQVILAKRIWDGVIAGVGVDYPDIRDQTVMDQHVEERWHNLPEAQRSLVGMYRFVLTTAGPGSSARIALEKGLEQEHELARAGLTAILNNTEVRIVSKNEYTQDHDYTYQEAAMHRLHVLEAQKIRDAANDAAVAAGFTCPGTPDGRHDFGFTTEGVARSTLICFACNGECAISPERDEPAQQAP